MKAMTIIGDNHHFFLVLANLKIVSIVDSPTLLPVDRLAVGGLWLSARVFILDTVTFTYYLLPKNLIINQIEVKYCASAYLPSVS